MSGEDNTDGEELQGGEPQEEELGEIEEKRKDETEEEWKRRVYPQKVGETDDVWKQRVDAAEAKRKAAKEEEEAKAAAKRFAEKEKEEFDILYGPQRATLYRLDKPSGWKERAAGEVKILREKKTGKCKVLMRRDRVYKICINHHISAHLKLVEHVGSDRALCWSPHNLTEESPDVEVLETLSIRFPNTDIAREFKRAFEAGQKENIALGTKEEPNKEEEPNKGPNKEEEPNKGPAKLT